MTVWIRPPSLLRKKFVGQKPKPSNSRKVKKGGYSMTRIEDIELIDPNEPYQYVPVPGDLLIVMEEKCQGLVVQVTDYQNSSPGIVSTNMGSFDLNNTIPMDYCALF